LPISHASRAHRATLAYAIGISIHRTHASQWHYGVAGAIGRRYWCLSAKINALQASIVSVKNGIIFVEFGHVTCGSTVAALLQTTISCIPHIVSSRRNWSTTADVQICHDYLMCKLRGDVVGISLQYIKPRGTAGTQLLVFQIGVTTIRIWRPWNIIAILVVGQPILARLDAHGWHVRRRHYETRLFRCWWWYFSRCATRNG
jgi:hypothetical protein